MSIATAYTDWSKTYDTNPNKTRDLDRLATRETLGPLHFETVLEMGCGTGKNTGWFAEKAQKVVGFDFSEGMLAEARRKISAPNVEFRPADLTRPWEIPGVFPDLISFNLVLEHIADLDFIHQQAREKLRPGGYLFTCELHPFKQYRGTKARFETCGGAVRELEVFVHHVSEFVSAGLKNGFRLVELREWWDADGPGEVPRLLSLLWQAVDLSES